MEHENNFLVQAIIASMVMHFVWITGVKITISPDISAKPKFADVTFLGSILEKTSFEVMLPGLPFNSETLYKTRSIKESEACLSLEGPGRADDTAGFPEKMDLMARNFTKDFFKNTKQTPNFFEGAKNIFYSIENTEAHKSIEGPIKYRGIIYKPKMPKFFETVFAEEKSFIVRLKFAVSKEGSVSSVEPVFTSGNPSVDLACMNYMRQWKFEPFASKEKDDTSWGVITLNIRLDK